MDNQNFIEKNRNLILKMSQKFTKLAITSTVPKFIKYVIHAKKIAKAFGYKSLVSFIKDIDKDSDALLNQYEKMTPEKQAKVNSLFQQSFELSDTINNDFKTGDSLLSTIDIAENVIENIGGEVDESDEDDEKFEELKSFIVDKFFDGIDITEQDDEEE